MRRIALLLLAALASFGLVACGGESTGSTAAGSSSTASDHNEADVMFAQMMIPHHQQAVEMADLADSRAQNPQVKALAAKIRGAQAPEIQTMTGWLTSWGQSATMSGGGHGSGHGGSTGMMTPEDMQKLMGATGAEFDRMFLTMMTEHHKSAITMAQDEQQNGQFAPAKELATQIVTTQQTEVTEMEALLKQV